MYTLTYAEPYRLDMPATSLFIITYNTYNAKIVGNSPYVIFVYTI